MVSNKKESQILARYNAAQRHFGDGETLAALRDLGFSDEAIEGCSLDISNSSLYRYIKEMYMEFKIKRFAEQVIGEYLLGIWPNAKKINKVGGVEQIILDEPIVVSDVHIDNVYMTQATRDLNNRLGVTSPRNGRFMCADFMLEDDVPDLIQYFMDIANQFGAIVGLEETTIQKLDKKTEDGISFEIIKDGYEAFEVFDFNGLKVFSPYFDNPAEMIQYVFMPRNN